MESYPQPASKPNPYCFRLYISGDTTNSNLALERFLAAAQRCLDHDWQLETIDVFQEPDRAADDGIRLIPTLVRVSPQPQLVLVGSLSNPSDLEDILCSGLSAGRRPAPPPES